MKPVTFIRLNSVIRIYSLLKGTESYPQFSVRIAKMLQNPEKIKELFPYLKKVGYTPLN